MFITEIIFQRNDILYWIKITMQAVTSWIKQMDFLSFSDIRFNLYG